MFIEEQKPGGGKVFPGFLESDHIRRHTAYLCMFHLFYVLHHDLAVDLFQRRHGVDRHDSDPAVVRLASVLPGTIVSHALRQIVRRHLIFSGNQVIVQFKFISDLVVLFLYSLLKIGDCRVYT